MSEPTQEDITAVGRAESGVVRWWWVRHAPTKARGFIGWTDLAADLSDDESISTLRSALPEEAALVTSDLMRAVQTAETISRRVWRRLPTEEAFREQHFGDWESLSFDATSGLEAERFWQDPAASRPPGGESFVDVCDRVRRRVNALSDGAYSDIVAVAHAGVIRAALAQALGLKAFSALAFDIAPLSLTRIDRLVDQDDWRIGCVNMIY